MSTAPDDLVGLEPRGAISPVLPLHLLLSVREHDRPLEVLEDEDLVASLPRRLGLKGVIDSQIRNYEQAVKRKRAVAAADVGSLIRLVLRRPDAEEILREAGERFAEQWTGRRRRRARFARSLPRRARFSVARRAARKLLRQIIGEGSIEISGRPLAIRVRRGVVTHVDPTGRACALYEAALGTVVRVYTGNAGHLVHERCSTQEAPYCEWMLVDG